MRKVDWRLVLVALLIAASLGWYTRSRAAVLCTPLGSLTSVLQLCNPADSEGNWGASYRNNNTVLDALFTGASLLKPLNGGTGLNGSTAASGTLLIGNGTGYTLAGLTAGTGITVTPGAGSITLSSQVPAFSAAGTQQANVHLVQDTATMTGGTVTVTLVGAAAFTSATTYTCTGSDQTTANQAIKVTQTSGSSVTFAGTGTDVVRFVCYGA